MQKIALDARLTRQMSVGMKAYASELATRLPRLAADFEFVTFTRGGNFTFEEQVRLPMAIAQARPALTHFLSLYAPFMLPPRYVVTIHDLIHLRFPQFFKSRVAPYYKIVVRSLCRHAARVITDDERTIEDLERFLGVAPAKVRVVALGASDRFFEPAVAYEAARPYFFYAGNHREHKDLPTLARAWAQLPAEYDVDLYVTGADDLHELRAGFSRERGSIVATGDVDEATLARMYAGAIALVHPALCEGFGLPMLEAMLQQCPVISCSDAVPNVLRPAAMTFAPHDASTASRWMLLMLTDSQRRGAAGSAARALAQGFTWDRCALETAQVYREVLAD